jgi:hypothetical protein
MTVPRVFQLTLESAVDGIKEMLDRLSDLDEGQLSDLESKIISEFETVQKQEPTAPVVESMTALADALDAVRGEQSSRVNAQKDLERRAAEATSRVKPKEEEDPAAVGDTPPADDTAPVDAAPTDAPADVPADAPTDVPPPEGEAETPAEDAVPGEETDEEKKKKAAPSTFAEAPAPVEPVAEIPAVEAEAVPPENVPAPAETPAVAEAVPTPVAVTSESPPAVVVSEPAPASAVPSAHTEEIPVAASAASDVVVTPPAENRPVPRQSATVAITAGADIPGISAGTELSGASQVTDAFIKRLHNLSRVSSPNGQQYTVATLTASFPEERTLQAGDTEGNWQKIQNVAGIEAITAAAGACIPLEIKYDIDGIGSTDTPVQDSLPRFTADRGGIRFYPSPLLPDANYDGAIGVWDPLGDPASNVTDLDGGNPRAEKPCLPVQCLPFEEAVLEAVSVCVCFDNLTGRVFPELVRAHNELMLVQHARSTEQFFLSKLKAGATQTVTANQTVGAAREILGQIDKVASVLRYRNRISPSQSFRVVMPYWVHDMIRADISYQMPGDGLNEVMALADAKLDSWFKARNVNITWSMEAAWGSPYPDWEDSNGASAGSDWVLETTTGFPETIEWDMFAEGTWLVLDGGTLDLGVIRDSTHVASNTYCEFSESFYNLAHVGGESVHVTSNLVPTGAASDLVAVP